METYLKLTINISSDLQELLIAELSDLNVEGFEQYDDHLDAYLISSKFDENKRKDIEKVLLKFDNSDTDIRIAGEELIQPQNWNENWEKSIKPLHLPPFYVRPTWSESTQPDDTILLEIDPKMAFGTGYHETTRLMLNRLPNVITRDCTVLDVGTGTGILAIASLKLGAKSAFGFDIDEWSKVNALENAELNRTEENFTIREGSFEQVPADTRYDVVLANVNRSAILSMADEIIDHAVSAGDIVLSGILDKEKEMILNDARFQQCEFVEMKQEGEWMMIHFRNTPHRATE